MSQIEDSNDNPKYGFSLKCPSFPSDSENEKNGAFQGQTILKVRHLDEKSHDQVENRKGTEIEVSNFGAFQG